MDGMDVVSHGGNNKLVPSDGPSVLHVIFLMWLSK